MTVQMITLIASTLTGFIFKYLANRQADENEKFKQLLQIREQQETSIQNARKFDGGTVVRRFIVFTAFLLLIFIEVGSGFLDGPTSMVSTEDLPWYLGGGTETKITKIYGMIYNPEELSIMVSSILGFYFGQSPFRK